jgi:sulfatase-like protein
MRLAAAAGFTVMVVDFENPVSISVAVTVCTPAVTSVTEKSWVPAMRVLSSGIEALGLVSLEMKWIVPPSIDALADDALVFTRTRAQASWTKPATASLLTGLFPYAHGATTLRDAIRPGVATLAELLRAAGYQTAAFVTNVNVGGGFGFQRGFDEFTYLPEDEVRPSLQP